MTHAPDNAFAPLTTVLGDEAAALRGVVKRLDEVMELVTSLPADALASAYAGGPSFIDTLSDLEDAAAGLSLTACALRWRLNHARIHHVAKGN